MCSLLCNAFEHLSEWGVQEWDSDASDVESDMEDAEETKTNTRLSYIGRGVSSALWKNHWHQHRQCWNITHGRTVGDVLQTPSKEHWGKPEVLPEKEHSDWLPQRIYDVMIRAKVFLDFCSLSPPDGKFQEMLKCGIRKLAAAATERGGKPLIIRILFGNIIGMPVDCDAFIEKYVTSNIPEDSNILLFVGAWRKGATWNHSKIVAVDGKHLITGGHNLWDDHYLKNAPVHDLSYEAQGAVAIEGHVFANTMWKYIKQVDKSLWLSNKFPDWVWLPTIGAPGRVTIAAWPVDGEYPPDFIRPHQTQTRLPGSVPIISCGRYGALHHWKAQENPSDTAFIAMIDSARTIIKMSLQDLGPLLMPGKQTIPTGRWPTRKLRALGQAIYERGVDVEIVLSGPNAVPGGLSALLANYGNGWSCADVASEIIKAAIEHQEEIEDDILWKMIRDNLRICYMRSSKTQEDARWPCGQSIANHAKFFIVDDRCYYIGSQNLYVCNLAEWGTIIDDKTQTAKILEEYWNPMWENSYNPADCDVEEVMEGLEIDRNGVDENDATEEEMVAFLKSQRASRQVLGHAESGHVVDHDELCSHYNIDAEMAQEHFPRKITNI